MPNSDLLSPWVRRFLLEHLVVERNLARNTQKSYRDALQQFLPFIARAAHRRIDLLRVEDVSPPRTRAFLQDLERNRRCGIATRNQRLAAIRSLARFIGLHSPEQLQWSGQIRTIASKKVARPLVAYLEKDELVPQRYPCHFRRNLWYSAELERGWSWKEVKDDRATDPRRWSGALQALG